MGILFSKSNDATSDEDEVESETSSEYKSCSSTPPKELLRRVVASNNQIVASHNRILLALHELTTQISILQQQQNAVTYNNNGDLLQNTPLTSLKTANESASDSDGSHSNKKVSDNEREKAERESLVLCYNPIQTVKYSTLESVELLRTYAKKILGNKSAITTVIAAIVVLSALYHIPGNHQVLITAIHSNLWFVVYWIGLGVLSSLGLGTGLHTFLLCLSPHIASVTLAAYECNSLNFPSPPYPDEIICPTEEKSNGVPSLWSIMSKLRLEACLWGAGTALVELPSYFVAKTCRLSGCDPDDAGDRKKRDDLLKIFDKIFDSAFLPSTREEFQKKVMGKSAGTFFLILAYASIPNQFNDLSCGHIWGHFLAEFWTFFGATLMGKAYARTYIYSVIFTVVLSLLEKTLDMITMVPLMGPCLPEPFKAFLQLAKLFKYFDEALIVHFSISIVNSLAQSYHKRIHKKKPTKKD